MYTLFAFIFLLGVCFVVAGFIGGLGTDETANVSKSVASALALLVIYAILILSMGSFSELASFAENLCGGIPYWKDIIDYGSFRNLLSQDLKAAVVNFLDTVILSFIIDLIMLLPLGHNQAKEHFWRNNYGNTMTNLLVAIVAAIVGLLLFNYVVKTSAIYQSVVSFIGGFIVILAAGTLPVAIISMIQRMQGKTLPGVGVIGLLFLLSKSKIFGTLRSAFFQTIVYVAGIWILEKYFGNIANGLSFISGVLVAFGPVLIMLVGLFIILRSVKW